MINQFSSECRAMRKWRRQISSRQSVSWVFHTYYYDGEEEEELPTFQNTSNKKQILRRIFFFASKSSITNRLSSKSKLFLANKKIMHLCMYLFTIYVFCYISSRTSRHHVTGALSRTTTNTSHIYHVITEEIQRQLFKKRRKDHLFFFVYGPCPWHHTRHRRLVLSWSHHKGCFR